MCMYEYIYFYCCFKRQLVTVSARPEEKEEAVAGAGEIALLPMLDVHGQHFGLDSLTISCDDLHALPDARLKEDQMQCTAGGAELEREREIERTVKNKSRYR